jgi:hypothetical protein
MPCLQQPRFDERYGSTPVFFVANTGAFNEIESAGGGNIVATRPPPGQPKGLGSDFLDSGASLGKL